MNFYIDEFSNYLNIGIQTGNLLTFSPAKSNIQNIVLLGLGGSGIGAEIVYSYVEQSIQLPVVFCKDYFLPGFVNENTLVIASSYSGNTEETIHAIEAAHQKNAHIICITSGGLLKAFANNHKYDCIELAANIPPRAYVACSFSQILFAFRHFGFINNDFVFELNQTFDFLKLENEGVKEYANQIAQQLLNKLPIIYSNQNISSVATRWRQQFNENSKILAWERPFPEMNHNELVGWKDVNKDLAAIFLHTGDEIDAIKKRFEISKEVILKYTNTVIDIQAKGSTFFDKLLYLILLGDWVSWYLAELRGVDAVEVEVINYLKGELSK